MRILQCCASECCPHALRIHANPQCAHLCPSTLARAQTVPGPKAQLPWLGREATHSEPRPGRARNPISPRCLSSGRSDAKSQRLKSATFGVTLAALWCAVALSIWSPLLAHATLPAQPASHRPSCQVQPRRLGGAGDVQMGSIRKPLETHIATLLGWRPSPLGGRPCYWNKMFERLNRSRKLRKQMDWTGLTMRMDWRVPLPWDLRPHGGKGILELGEMKRYVHKMQSHTIHVSICINLY